MLSLANDCSEAPQRDGKLVAFWRLGQVGSALLHCRFKLIGAFCIQRGLASAANLE